MSQREENSELHHSPENASVNSSVRNNTSSSPHSSNKASALYEPKSTPKIIRVLTVIAYILSVSLAAITLSAYYVFMWDGGPHMGAQMAAPGTDPRVAGKLEENSNWTKDIATKDGFETEMKNNGTVSNSTASFSSVQSPSQQDQQLQFVIETIPTDLDYDSNEIKVPTSPEVFSTTTTDADQSWAVETTSQFNVEFVDTVKRSKFLQKLMFKDNVDEFLKQQIAL